MITIEDILPKKDSVVDMIRVATYISQIPTALDMVKDAHDKGYETTVNLMAASIIPDREVDEGLAMLAKSEAKVRIWSSVSFRSVSRPGRWGVVAVHLLVDFRVAWRQRQDFDRPGLGVNEPVLVDTVLLVEVALVNAVAPPGPRREDLRHQIGGAHDPLFDDAEVFVGDEHHVGLGGVARGQHHVNRGESRFPQPVLLNPGIQRFVEPSDNLLVEKRRGRRHDQFSVPQLRGEVAFR